MLKCIMYLSLHIKKSLLGLAKTPTSFILKKKKHNEILRFC